jgi:DNA recombination protein RmuC
VRGDWGELMLENVLRGSGLEEGTHYDRQKQGSDDEGRVLRPDVVVRLPGDRCVVVDSKVNLVAWEEAMNADTPEAQNDAMRRHAVGLRQHVRDLADRNYPKLMGENALEVTIAFVPIEGALSAALGFDAALQSEAFERGVVFASPNTLMAVLRVVERLWTRDRIQKQAREIGEAGGLLLDALTSFLSEFDRVGNKLEDASKAYLDARNRLSESRQAVIPRARRLVALGARGKRKVSDELMPELEEIAVIVDGEPAQLLPGDE